GFGIEQAVDVHDEVAQHGIVDRALRRPPPGLVGLGVVRVDADDVEGAEVAELCSLERLQLAAENQMQELLGLRFRQWSTRAAVHFLQRPSAQGVGLRQPHPPAGARRAPRFGAPASINFTIPFKSFGSTFCHYGPRVARDGPLEGDSRRWFGTGEAWL